MDDALSVVEVVPGQRVGELLGAEGIERPVVDVESGQHARDRFEQIGLHIGEAALGSNRGCDPAGDEMHFPGVVLANTGSVNSVQRNETFPRSGPAA